MQASSRRTWPADAEDERDRDHQVSLLLRSGLKTADNANTGQSERTGVTQEEMNVVAMARAASLDNTGPHIGCWKAVEPTWVPRGCEASLNKWLGGVMRVCLL